MAGIGLSKPYAAVYSNSGTSVTYTGCAVIGKAVRLEFSINSNNENILYADNGPAESDLQFSGGTLTVGTDDLVASEMKRLFGLKEENISGTEITTTGAKFYCWDDSQVIPYVGFGGVIKKQIASETKYVGVVFPKVQFANPGITADTQGESVTWQTPEITGTVMRDDTTYHPWRWMTSPLDTEAEAEAAVKSKLGVPLTPGA